jgi:hypothetical protein
MVEVHEADGFWKLRATRNEGAGLWRYGIPLEAVTQAASVERHKEEVLTDHFWMVVVCPKRYSVVEAASWWKGGFVWAGYRHYRQVD